MAGAAAPPGLGPADDDELDVALGAQLRDRLEQRHEPLERHVGAGGRDDPAGHARASSAGRKTSVLDADRDDRACARPGDAEVADDVVERCSRDTVSSAGSRRTHPRLHPQERVPAAACVSLRRQVGAAARSRRAVHGDRVVHGGEHREARRAAAQQPVAEGLVVVDDVEVARGGRAAARPARRLKVSGSGKAAVHMSANSSTSIGGGTRAAAGTPERVGLAVEVEARGPW